MKSYAILPAIGAALAASVLTGCVVTGVTYVHGRYPYAYEERAVVVTPVPPPPVVVAPAPAVIIDQPPPPVIVESIPAPPAVGFVWIPGYYGVVGRSWVWVRGHYERPPHPGAVWVAPEHIRHGAQFEFRGGHWR